MTFEAIKEAFDFIKKETDFEPEVGIILGTGLGAIVKDLKIAYEITYDRIPNFPISTVESHHGRLLFGELSGKKVVVMQGRFHYYEGYNMHQIVLPVRVMKLMGIQKLIVSNAAGGLNPQMQVSDLMILNDHINLLPENPLTGKNIDELGIRFPDMFEAYDPKMIELAISLKGELGVNLHQGVYVSVSGPNLETPAEYHYLRTIGADAVGMSTVPEVIAARQMNLPVFAISVITDLCTPGHIEPVTIDKVLAAAAKAEPEMTKLIELMLLKI